MAAAQPCERTRDYKRCIFEESIDACCRLGLLVCPITLAAPNSYDVNAYFALACGQLDIHRSLASPSAFLSDPYVWLKPIRTLARRQRSQCEASLIAYPAVTTSVANGNAVSAKPSARYFRPSDGAGNGGCARHVPGLGKAVG